MSTISISLLACADVTWRKQEIEGAETAQNEKKHQGSIFLKVYWMQEYGLKSLP